MIDTPENTTKLNRESGEFTRYLVASRHTRHDKILGSVRVALGILFLMTGLMKLFVPELRAAFSGQLTAAGIPFHGLNMWIVPMMETAVGLLLLYGLFSRIGALIVIGLMLVATYVHLVVSDPALFPLQPTEPIIPAMAIGAAIYVVWRGGGTWSADLKWSEQETTT